MTYVGRQVIAKAHITIGQVSYKGLQTNVWNIKTSDELFNEIRTIWENMTLDYTETLFHITKLVIRMKSHLTKYSIKTVIFTCFMLCFILLCWKLKIVAAILKLTNIIGTSVIQFPDSSSWHLVYCKSFLKKRI